MFNLNHFKDEIPSSQTVINQLQEFCIKHQIPDPQYKIVQSTGTDHNPIFTYECRVSNVIRLANAGTKKGAKHLSAQKMFAALKEVCFYIFSPKLQNLKNVSLFIAKSITIRSLLFGCNYRN